MADYVLTVSALTKYIKSLLEENNNLKTVFLKGEISNFSNHYKTGHFYFTLKDENAQIKAVMFKFANSRLKFIPENNMSVIVRGSIGVYEKSGEYQIYVDDMQPDGTGALAIAFEQLKKKLFEEGLFDEAHKKAIPVFPDKVGVVTSNTGAAVRDIINVISRRYPLTEIVLYPVSVQGVNAAPQIVEAINYFNSSKCADVLIVGRGGGSIEDLWAFNEEIVARAVYNSVIPVISAVGHETDFTICDFVADLRAPTPSAAAELAVPDISALKDDILLKSKRLFNLVNGNIYTKKSYFENISHRLDSQNPKLKIENMIIKLGSISDSLDYYVTRYFDKNKNLLSNHAVRLDAVSPLKTLMRGYGVVSKDGKVISDSGLLVKGDKINIALSNGSVDAEVL